MNITRIRKEEERKREGEREKINVFNIKKKHHVILLK